METEIIKSRPGNVMENENLAKSHGKVMAFWIFINISHFLKVNMRKMC